MGKMGASSVVESTVPRWFNIFERMVFQALLKMWCFSHPLIFQHTASDIRTAGLRTGFKVLDDTIIPKGPYVLQFRDQGSVVRDTCPALEDRPRARLMFPGIWRGFWRPSHSP